MFVKAAKISDVAPGKLISVEVNGKEIVLANVKGTVYAVSRRCGHMCAPLEMGALNGNIITCPLHFAQFDATNGRKVTEPLPNKPIRGVPEAFKKMFEKNEIIRSKVKTYDLESFAVKIEGEDILVAA
ncbi:MAG TPA: Rieske 2Fe-2S domain-containing protein [Candidatus Micrarchaeota archaeon]|nr:Rieske 2Fe-2S domain-containing protein [Candidatus Micrarchaeota archaeon]